MTKMVQKMVELLLGLSLLIMLNMAIPILLVLGLDRDKYTMAIQLSALHGY